jgi:translation elongation factor EF-G
LGKELKEGQLKPLEIPLISADDELAFIAISRVFSGTLRTGDKILALGAKHQIGTTKYSEEIEIGKMYMLMGRDLIEIDSAPAGSLIGIAGIKGGCIGQKGFVKTS